MDTANAPRDTGETDSSKMEKDQELNPPKTADQDAKDSSIDAANEAQGGRLVLIHTALCLCTFLVGLVCPCRCLMCACVG